MNLNFKNNKFINIGVIVILIILSFFLGYQYKASSSSKQIDSLARGAYINSYPEQLQSRIEFDIEDDLFYVYESGIKVDEGKLEFMGHNTFKLDGNKEYNMFYHDGVYTLYYTGDLYEGRVDLKYLSSGISVSE